MDQDALPRSAQRELARRCPPAFPTIQDRCEERSSLVRDEKLLSASPRHLRIAERARDSAQLATKLDHCWVQARRPWRALHALHQSHIAVHRRRLRVQSLLGAWAFEREYLPKPRELHPHQSDNTQILRATKPQARTAQWHQLLPLLL